ncbi:MAG: cob(I)yrinic acid a,c-diamide adenosyltransferase [Robiginitomaculum sp.]|nr:cob(I)yrinic acid a,c-diamide adenosyltransferase [Robiginitomaculum sp.]
MVKLNKIYTRTGDDGSTGLADGSRTNKDCFRVRAYGEVDETNSAIGIARLYTKNVELDRSLARIQNDLFDLGADLSTPALKDDSKSLRMVQSQIDRLELELDTLNVHIAPLKTFVLPGGSKPAAYLHLARAITRRAEREIVAMAKEEQINPSALKYINRLSDYLFVAARWCNTQGRTDVKWVPGAER